MKFKAFLLAGVASLFLAGCSAKEVADHVYNGCQYLPAAVTIAKLASAMFPGVAVLTIEQAGEVAAAACKAVTEARAKSQGKKALVTPVVSVNGRLIYLYPDPSRPNQR